MGLDYKIKAIETEFAGVTFRSRLEATWASFFTAIGWEWCYEPFDLDGWLPDFSIKRTCGGMVLVEVKPTMEILPDVTAKMDKAAREKYPLLLCGVAPFVGSWLHRACAGWSNDEWGCGWDIAPMGIWIGSESEEKNPGGVIGFAHSCGWYKDRITGCYDGGHMGDGPDPSEFIMETWERCKYQNRYRKGE